MSELPSVETQLAVINTKLDTLIATQATLEPRIRTLENFRWLLLGVAVASGPAWSAIAARMS